MGCALSCSEEMMNNASFVDLQPANGVELFFLVLKQLKEW
jgi:hypothetical protein